MKNLSKKMNLFKIFKNNEQFLYTALLPQQTEYIFQNFLK